MNVLILTDRLGCGGAETHVASLAAELSKMHVDVTLASSGGALADELERAGIRQIRLPLDTHNPFRLLSARRALKKLIRREHFDVLHAHARIPAFLIRGLKQHGCAVVVSVHARFSVSPLLRRICYWGEATVAVSEDLRRYVCREYGIPSEQVRVIPNGIDLSRFSPPKERTTDRLRILFASRLDRDCSCGASLLCSIAPTLASLFPQVEIVIAGGGNAYDEILQQAANANGSAKRQIVTLLGERRDMDALLRTADIAVGVSRVALEAAASGCAVILCGNEGYLGILNRKSAPFAALSNFCGRGTLPPDTSRLQADIISLLEDPQKLQNAAAEAYELALAEWSSERMARQTLALYHRVFHPPYDKKITVGGYFGCGNLGDDAILQGFLEGLHSVAPAIEVTALTGAPRHDRVRFSVRCRGRKNPFSLLSSALRSSFFLLGGGSLLQNTTSNRSLSYYRFLICFFGLLGARPILYSAGIGPLYGERAKKSTARALGTSSYISLRDPESMHLLEKNGILRSRLHLGADPSLLLSPPPASRTAMLLSQNGFAKGERYLCIILKGGRFYDDIRRILLAGARMLACRHGLIPIFLVFDQKHDLDVTQHASQKTGWRLLSLADSSEAIAILRAASLTLTMRLHGMVLATVAHTPAIAISPDSGDEKSTSFALLSAQEAIRPEELSVAHLVQRAEQTLQNRHNLIPLLKDALQDLRKKAKKDLENIVTMIYNSK